MICYGPVQLFLGPVKSEEIRFTLLATVHNIDIVSSELDRYFVFKHKDHQDC